MENEPNPEERLAELIAKRNKILKWLNPPEPDPTVWPPLGWAVHPENPAFLYRVVPAADLQKELYGDPEREAAIDAAKAQLATIEAELIPYFFPKLKEEGTQRKKAHGFAAMVKTGLKREVDQTILYDVLADMPKSTEAKVIDWKASLKLKEFRELSANRQEQLAAALIITPIKPTFELVPLPANAED